MDQPLSLGPALVLVAVLVASGFWALLLVLALGERILRALGRNDYEEMLRADGAHDSGSDTHTPV